MPSTPSKRLRTSAQICRERMRHRAAVGVAQHQNIGAGVLRGFERPQREIAIARIAVEEMLGVVDHFFAVRLEIRDRIGDELQIFFLGDAQRAVHMQIPALAENRDDRRAGFHQRLNARVRLDRVPGEARRAEGDQPRVLELQVLRAGEEFLVPADSSPAIRLRCSRCPARPACARSGACRRPKS